MIKSSILILLIGAFLTAVAHLCGVHNGLPHMQYGDHWWLYITESLFYSGAVTLLWLWISSEEEKRESEYQALKRRIKERLKNENTD